MNQQELRAQVLRRLKVGRTLTEGQQQAIAEAMTETLVPYTNRDEKGAKMEPPLQPYNFDGSGVLWLEREVRRRLKL